MDAQAKKKALFRAKLNAQKQEKRIDSPLVRYNEHDQPVCKVCNHVLKSESRWPAHQASNKHHEAINNLKASAAAQSRSNSVQSGPSKELPKARNSNQDELHEHKPEASMGLPKSRPSSVLPSDFFDNQETKKQRSETNSAVSGDHELRKNALASAHTKSISAFVSENEVDGYSEDRSLNIRSEGQPSKENGQPPKLNTLSDSKQSKGALPEGFFDDKDADLRARGITPVKPDVKDEYMEFEKQIQEDLQKVDNRLEEEEFDAAEMIEEEESVEQRLYRERVETLRRKKLELKSGRTAVISKASEVKESKSNHEESSSSDDDSDETVDWRAKHL